MNWVMEQWVYAHSWEAAALGAPSRAAVSYRHEHAGVLQRVKARGQAGVISEGNMGVKWEVPVVRREGREKSIRN